MTRHEFLNCLRSLHCIDTGDVALPRARAVAFVRDPFLFFMRCDDETAEVIWRAVQARQGETTT